MSDPLLPSRRNIRAKRSHRNRIIIAIIATFAVLGSAFIFRYELRTVAEQLSGAEYSGDGSTIVKVTVKYGDVGTDIAKTLVSADVTKNYEITLRTIYASNPTFFPGTYKLPSKISSSKAISYLTDPTNSIVNRITIREGLRHEEVFELLSQASGLPVSDFQSAGKKLSGFGIPAVAPSLEGYLFPATYSFDPSLSARDILQVLVDRTKEQLKEDGVPKSKWHKLLTLASVIQREARQTQDFYKVARVFQNRLEINMPLQSDATVSYGVRGNTFQTSAADRNDPNPYNTYLYSGLPIGPISGAGALAIDAALNPAPGSWLYFVSVNLENGETVFSNTYTEHERAVAQWRKWLKENPSWND
jgi:UPF0755 protein